MFDAARRFFEHRGDRPVAVPGHDDPDVHPGGLVYPAQVIEHADNPDPSVFTEVHPVVPEVADVPSEVADAEPEAAPADDDTAAAVEQPEAAPAAEA